MRITFTETRVVNDHRKGTPDEERYEAGKTYDLPEPSALRWLNRNVAVPATEAPPAATETSAPSGGAVEIPDGWDNLAWPELKALAAKVSDLPIKSKAEAMEAINQELARRAAATTAAENQQPEAGEAEAGEGTSGETTSLL